MHRFLFMLAPVLWLACGAALGGEPQQLRLKWEELPSRIANKKAAFVLADGTRVEGKAIAVEPDGLRMQVSKTSNRSVQPKGKQLIARQSLSLLRVTEYRKLGRILVTAGAVGAAIGIVMASNIEVYEGPTIIIVPAVAAGGVIGVGIGGYYAGKRLDKRVIDIIIDSGR